MAATKQIENYIASLLVVRLLERQTRQSSGSLASYIAWLMMLFYMNNSLMKLKEIASYYCIAAELLGFEGMGMNIILL